MIDICQKKAWNKLYNCQLQLERECLIAIKTQGEDNDTIRVLDSFISFPLTPEYTHLVITDKTLGVRKICFQMSYDVS